MRLSRSAGARLFAGAFFLAAAARLVATDARIEIAAARSDGSCPQTGPPWGVHVLAAGPAPKNCVVIFRPRELSDAALDAADSLLARSSGLPALLMDFSEVPPEQATSDRLGFAIKKIASATRSGSSEVRIALDVLPEQNLQLSSTFYDEVHAYWDAVAWRPGRVPVGTGEEVPRYWLVTGGAEAADPVSALIRGLGSVRERARFDVLLLERPIPSGWEALVRFQKYFAENVGTEPTETRATGPDGRQIPLVASYDPKALTPLLFLPQDASGNARLTLAGGTFARASVENMASGAKRNFELRGARTLTLDLLKGPLAVVLQPTSRAGGETRANVDVGAARGLTAEEIVARERAWDAGQREKTKSFVAEMKASLRFKIAEVNETFDLTIEGPFFFERGQPADWVWREFYLNGVKWKGKTLPKLPILQPEKVTTLPLDIRLTEEYDYSLHGEATIGSRRAYHITYVPRSTIGDKPIYRGSVWIDKETFALLRRDSVQLNLKGETLSNVQTEIYRPVPGHPEVFLPLEIRGQQVFSTAGRTTAIERDVAMTAVELDPPDFRERRAAAYASDSQMIRDTEHGMRYLVPDAAHPGQRIVEEKISKKSTFGLLGAFYDSSLSYPIPLLGIQHFNFDLWGKGKQVSLFFGGALLTANYTDPSLAGTRNDLGADLFAVAFPFGDVSYRNGKEVTGEKIKHLPALFQVNFGRPLGPYLKASLGLFTKWDNFQRDSDTQADFRVPVDTFTDGAELRLVGNYSGLHATIIGSYHRRRRWEPWGVPGNPDYSPRNKDYWNYTVRIAKDQYFSGFRKLHVGVSYLGGADLDRFSKYEFGTFSGHPLHGFKSGSLRTERAWVANLSYGLNIEDVIRFEGFYDQAVLRDRRSGFENTYFSGAGLLASVNGPWQNSLLRVEVGVPVVSHGVRGFVVNVVMLKLF